MEKRNIGDGKDLRGGNLMCSISNWKNYVLPIRLAKDNEYLPSLEMKMKELQCDIEDLELENVSKDGISWFGSSIVSAVRKYLEGDLIASYEIVDSLVADVKDEDGIVSSINNSIAFGGVPIPAKEVQLYRARLSDHVVEFEEKDMLHIPFDMRERVATQRFSIPGLPCLYLGNTSYCCWIEMGTPADYQFNVSPLVLNDSFRLFNLTYTIRGLDDYIAAGKSASHDIEVYIKMLMLNIATSYQIDAEVRSFKSEYIFPQLLMLACKKNGFSGVIYYSKRVSNELFAMVAGINVVLFAIYDSEKLSSICDDLKIGKSFNYSMYKQLNYSLDYKQYSLNIDRSSLIKNIGSFDRQFPYRETKFYAFDNYLFANWDRK